MHIAFSMTLFFICLAINVTQKAHAQLKEVEIKEPTIEERVDQVFGTIVGHMASVLLWDVAAWDNNNPMAIRTKLSAGQSFADPLGWGIFVHDENEIKLLDFEGEEISKFSQDGLKIQQVWLIQQGRELLVKSSAGQLFFFHRNIKGSVTKALGPYSLPQRVNGPHLRNQPTAYFWEQ